jgi:hypothetical protein
LKSPYTRKRGCARQEQNRVCREYLRVDSKRGRLAKKIGSDEPLEPEDRWRAMRDLYTLRVGDFTVLYLPRSRPVDGRLPHQMLSSPVGQVSSFLSDEPSNIRANRVSLPKPSTQSAHSEPCPLGNGTPSPAPAVGCPLLLSVL